MDLGCESVDFLEGPLQSNGFRKSTPPQNHQVLVLSSNGEQFVDDYIGELTILNQLNNKLTILLGS